MEEIMINVKSMSRMDSGNIITVVIVEHKCGVFMGKDIYNGDIKPLVKEILMGDPIISCGQYVAHHRHTLYDTRSAAVEAARDRLNKMTLSTKNKESYISLLDGIEKRLVKGFKWREESFSIFEVTEAIAK